jgi:hypothetical protein
VKATKARIERDSIEFQGKLLAGALTSEAARALLDGLPAVENLMPPLDIAEFKVLGNALTLRRKRRTDEETRLAEHN